MNTTLNIRSMILTAALLIKPIKTQTYTVYTRVSDRNEPAFEFVSTDADAPIRGRWSSKNDQLQINWVLKT